MDDQALQAALQLTTKELEPCVRELAVTVPAAIVDQELGDQLRDAAKVARLPGFRPGKAPLAMVRNHFGKHASAEAVRRFQGAALVKAMEDEKLDVVTYPRPPEAPSLLPAGQDYQFSLTVNLAPEFELPNYRQLTLQVPGGEVDDEAVTAGIGRYREMHAEFAVVAEPAVSGDMLKLSYASDLTLPEGAEPQAARYVAATDAWAWLSDPEILPGITAGLTGVSAGETKELDLTFPADFRESAFAGKTARYSCQVHEVQRRRPVTDDAELCRRMNVADLDELRHSVRSMLEREASQRNRAELRRQATAQVCSPLSEIPLPPSLLGEAAEKEFRALANRAVRSEEDAATFVKDQDRHLAESRRLAAERMRQFFVFRSIAKAENIQVTDGEVEHQLQAIGRAYGIGDKDLRRRMADNGGLEDLHVDLLMSKVADFLVERALGQDATPSPAP